MQANVYNLAGEVVRSIELDDAIFGIEPNMAVVHQAVVRQQANARQGTANTRTRADVRGGGRKPWRQKGTGRARQGSTRSPQWTHGGVVFGPHTRSYEQPMPRKMRRLAIRSVLSGKARDGQLVLVESFQDIEPRTRVMSDTLKNLNITDKSSALIFTTGETNLLQAASNLGKVKTLSAHLLSVVDMLKYDYVVLPLPSLEVVTSILGNQGGRNKHELNGDGAEETETPRETPRAGAPTLNYTTTAEVQSEAATTADVDTTDTTADTATDATATDEATANTGVEAGSSDETSSLADVDVTATAAEAGDTGEEA
ncbi:MAG: 50S ribosomal protein L4 [Chloroflexota bacterium]|nr:50S ribosomal protein L4 [Chloroflexota bacterium]